MSSSSAYPLFPINPSRHDTENVFSKVAAPLGIEEKILGLKISPSSMHLAGSALAVTVDNKTITVGGSGLQALGAGGVAPAQFTSTMALSALLAGGPNFDIWYTQIGQFVYVDANFFINWIGDPMLTNWTMTFTVPPGLPCSDQYIKGVGIIIKWFPLGVTIDTALSKPQALFTALGSSTILMTGQAPFTPTVNNTMEVQFSFMYLTP